MRSPIAKKFLAVVNSPLLWIILACIPATVLFANRFLIPDLSTDTLSYHLFNGAAGAHDPAVPFSAHEFYPVGIMSLNPFYDTFQYLARLMVGYRLGTIVSLLAMVGIIVMLYKLLRLILREQRKHFHAGWGLLLVNAGIVLELYFQLATYFVDIINALAVLLVFYLILTRITLAKKPPGIVPWLVLWLLLGLLVALKLTNVALVIPLACLLLWNAWRQREKLGTKQLKRFAVGMFIFFLPLLPIWIGNYHLTKNPVFPFYNATFQSLQYPPVNFTDPFGTDNALEKLIWPLASARNQIRLAEPHHIYNDYKLALYWVCGVLLLGLLLSKKIILGKGQKTILFYFLASLLTWGILFGIGRYAVSSTALGGLLIAMLFAGEYRFRRKQLRFVCLGLAVLACSVLLVEDVRIMRFNLKYDMSWRPTLFSNQQLHKDQLHALFQKQLYVSPGQQKTIQQADILLNCHVNVSGFFTILPGTTGKPAVNIISDQLPYYADLSANKQYRQIVHDRLRASVGEKPMYTWVAVVSDDVGPTKENCVRAIASYHGEITKSEPLDSILGFTGGHLVLISGTIKL